MIFKRFSLEKLDFQEKWTRYLGSIMPLDKTDQHNSKQNVLVIHL